MTNRARRFWVAAFLGLAALALLLAASRAASAQTPALELTDFDETGLVVLVKMLVTAGSSELYRLDNHGTLEAGSDALLEEASANIVRIRWISNALRINKTTSDVPFNTYFDNVGTVTGDGADVSFYLQTSPTYVASSDNRGNIGGNYANFNFTDATARTAIGGIGEGDRFIFALARPTPVSSDASLSALSLSSGTLSPAFDSGTYIYTASVLNSVNSVTISATATDAGASVTGDVGFSTLTVGSNTKTIRVTAEDTTTTQDYQVTITRAAETTGTPSITPDPAGQDWTVATNHEFHTANTVGVMSVTISETGENRTGDLTLRSTEAGLTCDTQTNSLSVDTASSFWVRFCDEGTLTLKIVDNSDSTNSREYSMTIVEQANRAPSFASDTATRSVNENVQPGTNVGAAVTATDADNDTITYSLSSSDLFSINSSTGQISVATGALINYEVATSHTLTVTAADADADSDTITVTISVTDLDDAPQFTTSPADWTATIDTDTSFTTSLPSSAHPTQTVTVSVTDGTGTLRIRGSREGLTCDIVTTSLSLASAGDTVWVRACGVGTATVSIAAGNSAVDVRNYAVTVTAVPDSAPSQVTGLSGDAANNSIILDWTEPNDGGSAITRYEYNTFQTASGPWATTGSSDVGYTITQTSATEFPATLTNGNAYTVRVRACNSVGCGTSSASIAVTPRAPSAPSAPTSFTATAQVTLGGFSQVLLEWTAPDVDHDETITSYEYSSDNGSNWRSVGDVTGSVAVTGISGGSLGNFTLGTEYTFRVRAVNGVGNGTQSASDTATPFNIPSAPTNLTGSGSDGAAVLGWTAASANGQVIVRYEYSSDNGSNWRTTGGTGVTYTATATSAATPVALVNDTAYTFRVRAVNSFGTGPQSNSVSVTPTTNTVPGKVTGLTGTPGDGFMRLDWTAPGDGGSDIIRYEYDAYLVSPGTWLTTGGTDTTVTVTETTNGSYQMTNGQAFGFKVRAVNALGEGPASDQLAATPANQPPAFSSDTASRSVAENEPVHTHVGSPVTASDPEGNGITYSLVNNPPAGFNVLPGNGQIRTGQVLDRETTDSYTVTVRATATGGHDDIDVTITVTGVNEAPEFAGDSTTRSVPENSSGGTNVGTAVSATDPDSGDSLTYVLYNGVGKFTIVSGTGQIRVASNAGLNFEDTQEYDVTVRATDNGGLYDEISVTINITDELEPATLDSVTIGSIMRTSAVATFALTNVEGTSVEVYMRYRTPAGSGSWLNGGSESTAGTSVSIDMAGLTEGATYRVQGSLSSAFTNTVQRDFTTTANNGPVYSPATVTRQIEENRAAGTNIGAPVSATDADGDTLAYTVGGTDASAFAIDGGTAQLSVGSGTVLDFETKASYSLTVTATDSHSASATANVTIEVVDVREAGVLGRIVITVGSSGALYGYDSGSYGTLETGDFPGALFGDGNDRTVAEIREDADGHWFFVYSGGAGADWLSDQEHLDEIAVEALYEGDTDTRDFVLGGFVESRSGRTLELVPPLPSRDWASRSGEEIAFEFRRHRSQTVAQARSTPATDPAGTSGSFVEWLSESTPGGPVMAQTFVVIIVYGLFLLRAPSTSWGVMLAAGVLVMTPFVPLLWGFGDTVAAMLNGLNTGVGAYAYKVFGAGEG